MLLSTVPLVISKLIRLIKDIIDNKKNIKDLSFDEKTKFLKKFNIDLLLFLS